MFMQRRLRAAGASTEEVEAAVCQACKVGKVRRAMAEVEQNLAG